MKKITKTKTLLAAIGIMLAGLGVHILWDDYVQKKERHRKALEAEKIAAFIARRKARARAKAAERADAVLGTEENGPEHITGNSRCRYKESFTEN